ncbi:hypothetical protein A3Q56_06980 [Intoshia linei]|uniref:Fork-head domain-containing protein n=1 Tax=Intoshia linei TaxID=1819745 RepID=A0A177ATJ3_9BILA|nr:hypothetical protein A3Q56_06980 [Intoshia linei]
MNFNHEKGNNLINYNIDGDKDMEQCEYENNQVKFKLENKFKNGQNLNQPNNFYIMKGKWKTILTELTKMDNKLKPPISFLAIIAMALLDSETGKMVLNKIYNWIKTKFSYFKQNEYETNWKNSIRHNLSLFKCFVKNSNVLKGKSHYWSLHVACIQDFENGIFKKNRIVDRINFFNYQKKLQLYKNVNQYMFNPYDKMYDGFNNGVVKDSNRFSSVNGNSFLSNHSHIQSDSDTSKNLQCSEMVDSFSHNITNNNGYNVNYLNDMYKNYDQMCSKVMGYQNLQLFNPTNVENQLNNNRCTFKDCRFDS